MNLFSRFLPVSVAVVAIRVALDTNPENRLELVTNERIQPTPQHPDAYMVETPSGTSIAGPGDWIVKDEKGNLSVWDNENFRATYYDEEAAKASTIPSNEAIAKVCYEANRAYAAFLGDQSFGPWEDAPEWQRASNIRGVEFRQKNPNATPSMSHDAWLETKRADGWVYGETKDPAKKQHPCMVSYDELPPEQRFKDSLFIAIVNSLA